jgi:hypothetical protein
VQKSTKDIRHEALGELTAKYTKYAKAKKLKWDASGTHTYHFRMRRFAHIFNTMESARLLVLSENNFESATKDCNARLI